MNKVLQIILFFLTVMLVFIMGAFLAWTSDFQYVECNLERGIEALCNKYTIHMYVEMFFGLIGMIASWFIARAGVFR